MADALYLVRLPAGRCGQTLINGSDACIVKADDASPTANARAAAALNYGASSEIWADADVLALTTANVTTAVRLRTT